MPGLEWNWNLMQSIITITKVCSYNSMELLSINFHLMELHWKWLWGILSIFIVMQKHSTRSLLENQLSRSREEKDCLCVTFHLEMWQCAERPRPWKGRNKDIKQQKSQEKAGRTCARTNRKCIQRTGKKAPFSGHEWNKIASRRNMHTQWKAFCNVWLIIHEFLSVKHSCLILCAR